MKYSDVELLCCEDETDVLLEWAEIIKIEKPDIIIGYNTFGFDYKFILERAREIGCYDEIRFLGKNIKKQCREEEKTLIPN